MAGYFILFIALMVFYVLLHNSLVNKKNQVENTLGSINVYLKKRADLIPNLVSTVKTYMNHEEKVLVQLTQMRSRFQSPPQTAEEAVQMDQEFTQAFKQLQVTVENYPDLKANQNFIHLQNSLNEVEEQLSAARRAYNACVMTYNNAVEMVPTNIIASIMSYRRKPIFQVSDMEAKNPNLNELFKAG